MKKKTPEKRKSKLALEDLFLVFYAIVSFIFALNLQFNMKSLPSPLYGGDYYRVAGSIEHISNGGNPFDSDLVTNSIPGFLPFYGLVASFFKIFTKDTFKAMYLTSSIITLLSIIIYYFLFLKLSKNKKIALFLTASLIPPGLHLAYRNWGEWVLGPLSLILLIHFLETNKRKYFYLSSIVVGLISWVHSLRFLTFWVLNLVLIFNHKKFNPKNIIDLKSILIYVTLIILIAIPIYYKHIFIYKFQIKENFDKLDFLDLTPLENRFWYLFNTIKNLFMRYQNFLYGIISILSLLGLLQITKETIKKENFLSNEKIMITLLLTGFLLGFSYFITEPLFKKSLDPDRVLFPLLIGLIPGIFCIFGIKLINSLTHEKIFQRIIDRRIDKKIVYSLFYVLIFLIMIFQIKNAEAVIKSDFFFKNSMYELPKHYIALQKWIKENTNVNDVFLSTKELIFVINALTGRKGFIFRYMHIANPFESFFDREIDAAIILYGNDTNKKIELLKKYNVSYLYWDYYWISSEYQFYDDHTPPHPFDPLKVVESKKYEEILKNYNISYFKRKTWFDPGTANIRVRRFNLIFVSYENYRSFEKPWKEDLDPFLEEIWNYTDPSSNIVISRLYRIKLPS
ncbi:MAG: hypothetical protein QW524_00935 [Candidatus Woesearchaeota archaeon]